MASISGRAELLRSLLLCSSNLCRFEFFENSIGSPSSMDRGGLLIFCFDQLWSHKKIQKVVGSDGKVIESRSLDGSLFSYLAALAGSRETCDSCWRHFWTHKKHKGSWKQLLQQLHFRGVFVAL